MIRWPWRVRGDMAEESARKAQAEAITTMGHIEDALALRRDVEKTVAISRRLRRENHFADAVRTLMRGQAS